MPHQRHPGWQGRRSHRPDPLPLAGSCIVVDPKGENATITAQRRGNGSPYARGIGQTVRILDPFGEVQLDPALRARFNPLDVIDPAGELAIDDAGRIASAIIVRENQNDPFFEEAARNLLKGLILYVLSAASFEGIRNLVTVRRLATQGDWLRIALLRNAGEENLPSAFTLLWKACSAAPSSTALSPASASRCCPWRSGRVPACWRR